MKVIKRFIDEYKNDYLDNLKYNAGEICEDGNITNQQYGSEETFSIGMPIYSLEGEELGKLTIGLFENLNYSTDGNIKIPVETWRINGIIPVYNCSNCNNLIVLQVIGEKKRGWRTKQVLKKKEELDNIPF